MRRASRILRAGSWDPARRLDQVVLDLENRRRRRVTLTGEAGTAVLLDLAQAPALADGDGLVLEDGGIVEVRAAEEALVEITAEDARALARLAWHLGNRHLPVQIETGRLLIREDHVIVAMLEGLGARTRRVNAPFEPEGGAYGGHAQDHPHGHTHD